MRFTGRLETNHYSFTDSRFKSPLEKNNCFIVSGLKSICMSSRLASQVVSEQFVRDSHNAEEVQG